MKRTLLKRSTKPIARSPIRKRPRKKSETLRIYGPPARRALVASMPCAACGVVGYSENAHLTPVGEKGTGYKGDYRFIGPLCGKHFVGPPNAAILSLYQGCHSYYDRFPGHFRDRFPDFNAERVARETEKLWLDTETT